ncbi:hypothetical protein LCGC14_1302770 [marine sediment metagenome]|uniref:PD-(D/E)XK endonuclease-like domain-containing protein n=1 Tax=marine sediment metagenome TaxID=412755 RepID=A0A0F9KPH1_9ZZZZ
MKPIVLDRTRLGQYATCPRQAYLAMIWEALKAKANGLETFPWEKERIINVDPKLIEAMKAVIHQSTDSLLRECGTEIHDLLKQAFDECKNNLNLIPEWFVDNLPKIKPNIQPMAIRHARHAADLLSEYHVNILAVEHQVSLVIHPETATTPAVIVTMRYDLIGSGKGNLHVMDWKTGFKRLTNQEAAESFQAEFGAWLLFQQEPYKEINLLHWWYFETMWGTKAYARFDRLEEHPRLPGLTTEVAIQGRVLSAVDLFLKNCKDAWPLPYSCSWCEMIRFCPNADMSAKEIADDPKAYVDRLVVVTEWLKRQKAAATAWIKGKGPLAGTKVAYTRKVPQAKFSAGFEDLQKPKGPAKTGDDSIDGHFK